MEASNTGILVHNVDRPRGLAVDWIHLNLYFINGLRKTIFIVKMEATKNGMHNAPNGSEKLFSRFHVEKPKINSTSVVCDFFFFYFKNMLIFKIL